MTSIQIFTKLRHKVFNSLCNLLHGKLRSDDACRCHQYLTFFYI